MLTQHFIRQHNRLGAGRHAAVGAGLWAALPLLLLPLAAGCTKSVADKLVGAWRVEKASETVSNGFGTSSAPLSGYENYTIYFADGSSCAVVDRTDTTFYGWYVVGDTTLVLAEQHAVVMEYHIDQLESSRLELSQHELSESPTDGTMQSVTLRFELKKM